MTEALRDRARWLYRQLQTEYDHLTSDEVLEDGIIANEYTFTEGGAVVWVRTHSCKLSENRLDF